MKLTKWGFDSCQRNRPVTDANASPLALQAEVVFASLLGGAGFANVVDTTKATTSCCT